MKCIARGLAVAALTAAVLVPAAGIATAAPVRPAVAAGHDDDGDHHRWHHHHLLNLSLGLL